MNSDLLNYSDSESDDEDLFSSPEEMQKPQSLDNKLKIQQLDEYLKTLENPKINKTWCKICEKELKSAMHAKTHYESGSHSKNLFHIRDQGLQNIMFPPAKEVKSHCKVCNLSINGDTSTNGHINTETHKRNSELYCAICEVKTVSKDALWEHQTLSQSHLQKALQFEGNLSQASSPAHQASSRQHHHGPTIAHPFIKLAKNLTIPQVCVTPKMPAKQPVSKTLSVPDYGEDNPLLKGSNLLSLGRSEYCNVCNTYSLPVEFSTHLLEFPHLAMEMLQHQYPSGTIDKFCLVTEAKNIVCLLCNITMKGLGDVKSHLNGTKHIKKFKLSFSEIVVQDSKTNGKTDVTGSVEKPVLNTQNELANGSKNVRYWVDKEPVETNGNLVKSFEGDSLICYLCKMDFKNKIELNVHTISFPHMEMAKWKSEAVFLGVPYAEYWMHSKNSLTCTLCEAQFSSAISARSHMNDSRHKTRLLEWSRQFASWKLGDIIDPKFFYCAVCDFRLPGTSEANCHYNTDGHLKRLDLYCKTCKVSNSTEKILLEHQMSKEHKERIFRETVERIDTTNKNVQDSPDRTDDPKRVVVEAQIFQQVKKLVHTLYYSKTVPHDVALKYLKRINAEVADLKEKHGKKASKLDPPFKNSKATVNGLNKDQSDERSHKEYTLESFVANKHTGEDVLRVTIEEKHVLKKSQKEEHTVADPEPDKKGKTFETPIQLLENSDLLLEKSDFMNAYMNITKLRQRIAEPGTAERDLLDEIKSLIYAVSTSEAPLEKVLVLLQGFNRDLDSAGSKFKDKNQRNI